MQAGICAIVAGEFDVLQDYTETVTEDGHDLDRSIEIDRIFSLPSGDRGFAGTAAAERLVTRSTTQIVDGEIRVTETDATETVRSAVAGVPGEFVLTANSTGTFAFDLIGAQTGTDVDRGRLDLSGFLAAHDDGSPWKAGFYDGPGPAAKGTVYGEDLLADEAVGPVLDSAALNQLGIDYAYAGQDVKVDLTESGFVQRYRPRGQSTAEFLGYVAEEILPHLTAE